MCAPISVAAVGGVGGFVVVQAIGAAILGSILALNFFHPLKRLNRRKVEE